MTDKLYTYLRDLGDEIGVEFYAVGGSIRDEILGIPTADHDVVARGLSEQDLMAALRQHGKVDRTGAAFGVIRYFPRDKSLPMVEIALPRKELSIGFGHKDFTVEFDHTLPIEEDLIRRDFTVNAIARDLKTGKLIDPCNGLKDLENRKLRVISDTSAQDDPLRVFRAIRFVAKLGFDTDPETDAQLRAAVNAVVHEDGHDEPLLLTVSAERFQMELLKMVTQPHIAKGLRYAHEIGALALVLPELDNAVGVTQNKWHSYDVFEHTLAAVEACPSTDPYVKLAMLFHDIGKVPTRWVAKGEGPENGHFYLPDKGQEFEPGHEPRIAGAHEEVGAEMAYEIMQRMKFSTHASARVSLLVREHMFAQGANLSSRVARRFLARLANSPGGQAENAHALFEIRWGDLHGKDHATVKGVRDNVRFAIMVYRELDNDAATSVKDLAVNGHDLMAIGLVGPAIGGAQKALLELVLEDPELNERERLLELVPSLV